MADDTLLFYASKVDSVLVVKTILLAFEGVSGLKINFYKKKFIHLNMDY